jgi:hypothetical protein
MGGAGSEVRGICEERELGGVHLTVGCLKFLALLGLFDIE